ncbi:hypothetical protein [Streptomyces sp. F001]|uniref:hypothetical protein n=1 Tax=Streptomyces sp. F001 TaxID=1510026 RepID=UPI00101E5716|nr:hypothetical protein [Streptomyces sp. F001]
MANDLEALRANLIASPVSRAKFIANVFDMLEKSGVDVQDQAVIDALGLNLDLRDGQAWVDETLASSAVVTIIH